MQTSRDANQFPTRAAIADLVSFYGIVPCASGGNPSTTGMPGVPSGTPVPLRTGIMTVTKTVPTGIGLWTIGVPNAPQGTIELWPELNSGISGGMTGSPTGGVAGFTVVKRDLIGVGNSQLAGASGGMTGAPTGSYYNVVLQSATGGPMDPLLGDVIAIRFTAFSTGTAAGP